MLRLFLIAILCLFTVPIQAQVFPNNGFLPPNGPQLAARGPNYPRDNSGQLIEAMQRTIAPGTWDVNGGQGAIYYYRQQHSLIIKQTQQQHEQLQDLLQQLRRQ